MFNVLLPSLRRGVLTERMPFGASASFGFPVIAFERCVACDECAAACPTGAIQVTRTEDSQGIVSLSLAGCIQCRECADACREGAIQVSPLVEVAAHTRAQLASAAVFDVEAATGRGRFVERVSMAAPTLEESGTQLRERIQGRLGRSLHVRQVDAGSCNGCELEIAATGNPLFDLERFGIHFVASPRHADVLLVTGPVTRNMEVALRRTYEATPEPRIVVAVGACGCSGGLFGEGTYASVGAVDLVVPVDIVVPGCPPRPQAILHGLLMAMGAREARLPDGAQALP